MSTFPCKITFDDYVNACCIGGIGFRREQKKRVLFLVGVSYSGKSTFAEKLRSHVVSVVRGLLVFLLISISRLTPVEKCYELCGCIQEAKRQACYECSYGRVSRKLFLPWEMI